MYLMIFEDGTKWRTPVFSEDDKLAVTDGVLEVIDLSDAENPREFFEDAWYEIPGETT